MESLIYFLFGLSMVITLIVMIILNYSKKNKHRIEQAKYSMMHDDDE